MDGLLGSCSWRRRCGKEAIILTIIHGSRIVSSCGYECWRTYATVDDDVESIGHVHLLLRRVHHLVQPRVDLEQELGRAVSEVRHANQISTAAVDRDLRASIHRLINSLIESFIHSFIRGGCLVAVHQFERSFELVSSPQSSPSFHQHSSY